MKKETKKTLLLALCALAVGASMLLAASGGRAVKTDYYDTQVKAAQQLQRCMERVKLYKQELSIPLSPDEYFDTGMLGEQYNFITTSIGELGAKRTSANPDMAALAVKMFHQAGLKKGDRIGAGFSGSFPCLNLAVICAAQTMEIEIVPITSVGASTYGANNPQLSFPEMLHMLYNDGLVNVDSAFVTLGGDYDTGVNMDEELLGAIVDRLEGMNLTMYKEKNLAKNVEHRLATYGDIDCFVAVGGNVTTAGTAESAVTLGQGVLSQNASYGIVDEKSGVIQHCLADNIRVINFLNIKKIVSEYGIPFDPLVQTQIGTGHIYYGVQYQRVTIAVMLLVVVGLLMYIKKSGL